MLPSQASKSRKTWAVDFVQILFKGVELLSPDDTRTPGDNSSARAERRLGVVAEARLFVTDKSKFSLLKGKVDHDVAFNARTGQFSLNLRAEVGRTITETLENRLRAIERLVGFLDAIRKQNQGTRCESVTLRRLVFTYGGGPSERPAGQDGADAAPPPKRWKVTLDLASGKDVGIELEKGNPHARVLDYLVKVANDPISFESIPYFLSITLPLQRDLEKMEESWGELQRVGRGELAIFPKSLDWFTLTFALPRVVPGVPRQVSIDVKLRLRNGQGWWHFYRAEGNAKGDDEFSKAFQRLWEGRGQHWKGVTTGVIASPELGTGECLAAIDMVIRAVIEGSAVPTGQIQQRGQAKPAPARQGPGADPRKMDPKRRSSVVDLT